MSVPFSTTRESFWHNMARDACEQKLRRAIDRAFAVEGVRAVRGWCWESHIAVAVSGTPDVLAPVRHTLEPLMDSHEIWDVGLLADA